MMDNYRILHGRTAYDSSDGDRFLQGCYIDFDSTEGKLRHLKRKFNFLTLRDSLIAALVPIFLGFGFVIAKPAMNHFPPILLMGLRFTFAASILIWWFPIPKKYLKKIFIASLVANTLQYSITYSGLNLIDASAAVLLVQTEVPFE